MVWAEVGKDGRVGRSVVEWGRDGIGMSWSGWGRSETGRKGWSELKKRVVRRGG